MTRLLPSFSNDRSALFILLTAVPATLVLYGLSFVAPAVVVVLLTSVITGAICILAMQRYEQHTREGAGPQQLMSSLLERQVLRGKRLAIIDPETMLFKRWYFDLRLAEEISRCRRYGSAMTILGLKRFESPPSDDKPGETELEFVQVFTRSLRAVDLAAKVGRGQYCVCLPHTDARGGESVISRLMQEFAESRIAASVLEFRAEEDVTSDLLIERALAEASTIGGWQRVAEMAPQPVDAEEVVANLRYHESSEVRLSGGESANSMKTRLRRAAKKVGVRVTISERDGVLQVRRGKAKSDKVPA